MRLSNRTHAGITSAIRESFGNVDAFLFGRRLDDNKKGDDIDIAIKSNLSSDEFKSRRIKVIMNLVRKDFDWKLDIVQYCDNMDKVLKSEIDLKRIQIMHIE